ncbi:hypothetical protein ACTHAM_001481 [Cellulomonas soli]|uniref:hypothetical protein n=1 Tax=Cellulomonas soli TaxID=931535 RepID=UPI003F876937
MGVGDLFARLTGRAEPERAALPSAPTADDLEVALVRVEAMVAAGAVPAPVASRVARVVRVVRDTVPRLDRLGAGSQDAYDVMATATRYLPEAVGAYLRLPREWANSRPVDNGRSSLLVLVDQLDLLGRTMDQVLDAVTRADAVALVAHGRFLAEKFGHPEGSGALSLGAAPVVPPASAGPGQPTPLPGSTS